MAASGLRFELKRVGSLRPHPRNARVHSKGQVQQIARSIKAFGHLVPIVVDEMGFVLAGHGRLAAAKLLGLREVPTVCADGLTDAQKRAFMLADNKLAEKAGWDREQLAVEFADLGELLRPLDLDITVTGFDPSEIDAVLADLGDVADDPGDALPQMAEVPVTQRGDLWLMGSHRVLCGDARLPEAVARLMGGEIARMVFTDPPYNSRIFGNVQGRGSIKHEEFAFASGEMDRETFTTFLTGSFAAFVPACADGAIAFVCMDWRNMASMVAAGEACFTELKNLIVWNKASPGQGSFYRSQHELIFVFKVGTAAHINGFGLGKHGRMRANVWTYAGGNSFRAGRMDELKMHPTVKPVALVADAMRDCSLKGDVVLDVFLGSGTTVMAAQKVGRRGYGIEYEPKYVDVAVRRWQAFTRQDAILDGDGRSFAEIAATRAEGPAEIASSVASPPVERPADAAVGVEAAADDDSTGWIALAGGMGGAAAR